ncbi:MAG: hypothetical protein JWO50_603 [Candidatus Kaiserbacteria bacterium]|nr:hypothetical protein [Candidatus Kaiserbacteria bacterium]
MNIQKILIALVAIIVLAALWFFVTKQETLAPATDTSKIATTTSEQPTACFADAKICPDGSAVGRVGPNCEFAACPSVNATSSTVHTTVGQKVTGLGVTITPIEVVEDSRCPANVNCIWAGTVKVRTKITSAMGTSEMVLELGVPTTTEAEIVTLTEVTPQKVPQETIPISSYRFVFTITKK